MFPLNHQIPSISFHLIFRLLFRGKIPQNQNAGVDMPPEKYSYRLIP